MSTRVKPASSDYQPSWSIWALLIGGFGAVFSSSMLALWFVHNRGVTLSGDEPSYVGAAFGLGRLHTWNLGPAFASTGLHHLLGASSSLEEAVLSHGVQFPDHAIGFSALLAPSLALVNSLSTVHLELLAMMSALVVWLGVEVTKLTGAPRSWLFLVVALFLAPGYLLATTQVYPDLLSGLVLAVVIVRLMQIERDGPPGTWSMAVTGALLLAFVWIDDKNIVIGILIGAITALVARRRGAPARETFIPFGLVLFGAAGVAAFNLYAYGHPLGPTQAIAPFSSDSLTKMVALVFDRRHGILVQSPAALLGLVGAVRWWRRAPWSVTVGVAAVVVVLVANASLVGGMNGGSFVGRYEWEALPLALAFGGMLLIELATSQRRIAAGIIAILFLLALLESWALFASRPNDVSFIANGWDPAAYLGWWGRIDPSPILNYLNGQWANARNLWGLGTFVALAVSGIAALTRLLGGAVRLTRISATALLVALVCWTMSLASPFLLPTPLHYTASDLGPRPVPLPSRAITVDGPGHRGLILSGPHLEVLPGKYRVTITYSMVDSSPRPAEFTVRATGVAGSSPSSVRVRLPKSLALTRHFVELLVTAPGTMSAQLIWTGSGRLTVRSVTFTKFVTCRVVECQGGWF